MVSAVIVSIGRRYGRHDQRPVERRQMCLVKLSGAGGPEALARICQTPHVEIGDLRPSTATMRKSWPARTGQARPERRGTVNRSTSARLPVSPASRA
jgi:hypothetical protein